MSTLDGIDLQLYINKILPRLAQDEWPPAVCEAAANVSCEVDDHGRGLVTYASVRSWGAIAIDALALKDFRWPENGETPAGYDPIRDRTPEGVEALIRAHLRYMKPQIEDAIKQLRQDAS